VGAALRELRARIGAGQVRAYALGGEGSGVGLDGEVAERLAAAPDGGAGPAAVVAIGDPKLSPAASEAVDRFAARNGLVQVLAAGYGGPDPLPVAWRLYEDTELADRLVYLRATGRAPMGPYLVGHLDRANTATAALVESISDDLDLETVLVDPASEPLDLVALLSGAQMVVTDSPPMAVLATGQLTPTILTDAPGLVGVLADAGAELARYGNQVGPLAERLSGTRVDASTRQATAARTDMEFDRLALALRQEAAERSGASAAERVLELERLVETLEAVNDGLRRRLGAERAGIAAYLRDFRSVPVDALGPLKLQRETQARRQAEDRAARLQEELDRIHSTRTMRMLQPARGIYSRVRSTIR